SERVSATSTSSSTIRTSATLALLGSRYATAIGPDRAPMPRRTLDLGALHFFGANRSAQRPRPSGSTIARQPYARPRASSSTPIVAIGACAVLAALLIVNLVTLTALASARTWAIHTGQVRDAVARVRIALSDAETGQAGYLLTRQPRYLEAMHSAEA